MPTLHTAHLRHAGYYAQRCAQAEETYRSGHQPEGLAEFDQERLQIDTAWNWLAKQPSRPETDDLILAFADASASIGEIRHHPRDERVVRLEAQLAAALRRGRARAAGHALGNLALAFAYLGDYSHAVEGYQQRISIARTLADQHGEAATLSNLGNAYKDLARYQEALQCHQQSLALIRELGDRRGEGAQYGNIGAVYQCLKQYEQAIVHFERYRDIAREVGDRRGEGNALSNLALAHSSVKAYHLAVACGIEALEIMRSIQDRRGEGNTLTNLGCIYLEQRDYEQAALCFDQQLAIASKLGDLRGISAALSNLGVVCQRVRLITQEVESYQMLTTEAIDCYEKALAIDQQIGDREGEALNSWNLALLYEEQGDLNSAVELCLVYIDFGRSVGYPNLEHNERRLEDMRRKLGA